MFHGLMVSLCLIFSSTAFAEGIALVKETKSYREGDSFVSEITFNQPVTADQVSFEFLNKTVQANIKNAGINSGKETKQANDAKVDSVFTYQYQPGQMRSRIIYKDVTARELKGRIKTEAFENTLRITIQDPAEAVAAVAEPVVEAPKKVVINEQPPIDLDRELERALKIEVSDETVNEKQEEAELIAAAAEVSAQSSKAKADKASKNETKIEEVVEVATTEEASSEETEASRDVASTEEAQGETNPESEILLGAKTEDKNTDASGAAKVTKAEAEIPLGLDAKKVKDAESSPWVRLMISLGVVSVVGIGLVVGVKKFAKDKTVVGGNLKVKVVSQHALGPKKSLAVIHIAGESILIGITDHNISLIKSLALIDDELTEDVAQQSFDQQMRQVSQGDRYTPTRTLGASPAKERNEIALKEDEFLIGNIKDLVNTKLKEMRTL